jgi:hypothetical protein
LAHLSAKILDGVPVGHHARICDLLNLLKDKSRVKAGPIVNVAVVEVPLSSAVVLFITVNKKFNAVELSPHPLPNPHFISRVSPSQQPATASAPATSSATYSIHT